MLHSVPDCSTNDGHILAPSCNLEGASQSFGFVGTIMIRTLYSFIFWNCVLVTMNRHLKSKTQFHILCSVIYPALFTLMFSTFIHVFSPRNIPFLCFCPFLSLSQQHVCSQGIFLSLNVKLNTDILVEKYFLLKKKRDTGLKNYSSGTHKAFLFNVNRSVTGGEASDRTVFFKAIFYSVLRGGIHSVMAEQKALNRRKLHNS